MSMLIEDVRLSFPSLFEKTAFDDKETPKYKAMLIMAKDHKQYKQMMSEIKKCMMEKWGEKPQGLKLCVRDGKEKEDMDGFGPDVVFFNASNMKRPGVYDRDQTPLTAEDDKPYAGCYVNVRVSFWAQDNKYGKRINCELNGVQFSADGESFGGGGAPAAADDFPELDTAGDVDYDEAEDADWDDDDLL